MLDTAKIKRSIKLYQDITGNAGPVMSIASTKKIQEAKALQMLAQLQQERADLQSRLNAKAKPAKVVNSVKYSGFKPLQRTEAEPFAKSAANIRAKYTGKPTPQPEPFANSVAKIKESWSRGVSIGY